MNEWEWQLLEDKPTLQSTTVDGVEVKLGDRVLLRPRPGGDIMDLALAGMIATVESIEQDYEGELHLSIVVDDDPGRDIGLLRQPGHRFFFKAAEIEPLDQAPFRNTAKKERTPSILIAGIGNIFLGDDAFGVEVVRRMAGRSLPSGTRVQDFGIRGLDLSYALLDGADVTILVDAYSRGGAPGDLYIIEPHLNPQSASTPQAVDAHSMDPVNVIRAAQSMGGPLKKILLLGCEPQTFGPEEGQMGLSEPVQQAVGSAVVLLESAVARILAGEWPLQGLNSDGGASRRYDAESERNSSGDGSCA